VHRSAATGAVQTVRLDHLFDARQTLRQVAAIALGYLKATLEAIAAGHPKSRIDDLLPWNFKPST